MILPFFEKGNMEMENEIFIFKYWYKIHRFFRLRRLIYTEHFFFFKFVFNKNEFMLR